MPSELPKLSISVSSILLSPPLKDTFHSLLGLFQSKALIGRVKAVPRAAVDYVSQLKFSDKWNNGTNKYMP